MLPGQVQMKLPVEANRMIVLAEAAQEVDHAMQEGSAIHTTLAAECRWPMRDSSLRKLHHLRGSHELIRPCKADSLSAGRWAA